MDPVSAIGTIWNAGWALKQILDEIDHNRSEILELEDRISRLLPMLEILNGKVNNDLSMSPILRRLAKLIQISTDFIRQISTVKTSSFFVNVFNFSREATNSAATKLTFMEINLKFDQIILELSAMEIMDGSSKIGKLSATLDGIAKMLQAPNYVTDATSTLAQRTTKPNLPASIITSSFRSKPSVTGVTETTKKCGHICATSSGMSGNYFQALS